MSILTTYSCCRRTAGAAGASRAAPTAPVAKGFRCSSWRAFAQREWLLEPGDLLYLPPGVAHDGVAVGADCMTFSVGFRSPSWSDLAAIWAEMQAEQAAQRDRPWRPRDAGRDVSAHPARLPAELVEQARDRMLKRLPRRSEVASALLRHLSEPKPRVTFDPPAQPMTVRSFAAAAARHGVRLDARSRMLYARTDFAINGEMATFGTPTAALALRSLADRRQLLTPIDTLVRSKASTPLLTRLYDWYRAGWLHPHI